MGIIHQVLEWVQYFLSKQLAEFMQTYGGWGVAIVFLAMYLRKDKECSRLSSIHGDKIAAVIRECTAVITSVEEALERCERRQDRKL